MVRASSFSRVDNPRLRLVTLASQTLKLPLQFVLITALSQANNFELTLKQNNNHIQTSSIKSVIMSGEAVMRPDKDHSKEVDKQLPEAEELAKVGYLNASK